ncbi:MAG: polyisoprenoid-binding protein [Actinobacteria bacterium]|nr:polyisoprenoid-binding protein [Actinomycetota bacterium]
MSSVVDAHAAGVYAADPVHSTLGFAIRHMGVSTFRGSFGDVSARFVEGSDGRAVLEGSAPAESISITSPPEFRAHVLGEEFLDAGRYPEITFRSQDVQFDEGGHATVRGELTIRGITRPMTATGVYVAPVKDPWGGLRAALELEATIDRREFGMRWNTALPNGGDALGAKVTLSVHLELVREA